MADDGIALDMHWLGTTYNNMDIARANLPHSDYLKKNTSTVNDKVSNNDWWWAAMVHREEIVDWVNLRDDRLFWISGWSRDSDDD